MARLESKVDLMHVPTPAIVVDRLRALLHIPAHASVLDPCCGTGAAIQALAPKAARYGIEIELDRSRLAATHCTEVLPCAMQDAKVSHEAFGLLFLNPPYDDSTEGRLEEVFLERCMRYLMPGGVLVLIIKQSEYSCVAPLLRRHFDIVGHWRFPDGWYDGPEMSFTQTALVARRRSTPAFRAADEFWKGDLRMDSLEPLPESFEIRVDVPVGRRPRCFVSGAMRPDDLVRLLATSPVSRDMDVPSTLGCGEPLMPLKQGHLAMTLASGCVNGVYGLGPTLHVAKGTVIRQQKTEHEMDETAGGRPALIKKETDSFAIKVRALVPSGKIHDMVTTIEEQSEEAE
jgi:SAM-dependent methyltransferase